MKTKLSKKKKMIIVIVIIVILVIVGLVALSMAMQSMLSMGMPVSTATVSQGDIVQEMDFSGTVVTEETKVYFSPVTGRIETVDVAVGDQVQAGDSLLTYDLTELEQVSEEAALQAKAEGYGIDATMLTLQKAQNDQVAAARNYDEAMQYVNHYSACLESATRQYNEAMAVKTEYDTLKATVNQYKIQQAENTQPNPELANLITQGENRLNELAGQLAQYDFAALESAVTTCSNDLNEYKAQAQQYKAEKTDDPSLVSQQAQQSALRELNNLSKERATEDLETARAGLHADFDGVVTEIGAVAGQTAAEGMQMFVLQSTEDLKVAVSVTKYDLAQISVGQKAVITINGKEYEGVVTKIDGMAQVNAAGASVVTADIHINNPDEVIYLGIEAKVKIESDKEENVLLVPIESVNYDTKGAFCYVVEDGVIVRKEIEVGISSDTQVQILSGLSVGEQVITEVTTDLEEGMAVTPVTEE